MKSELDRFGVPEENIKAAMRAAEKQKRPILKCYVPTRKEVASLPGKDINDILIGWMIHSPLEIIPSRAQIDQVRLVLLQRSDVSELSALVAMCNCYIVGD